MEFIDVVRENGFTMTKDVSGNLHSFDDEPATWNHDHTIEKWYLHGKLHRVGAPALINHIKKISVYMLYGILYNPRGPSIVQGTGGNIRVVFTDHAGRFHNAFGPAKYSNKSCKYYIHGKRMCEEDWLKYYEKFIHSDIDLDDL